MKDPQGKISKAAIIVNDKIFVGWRHADIRNAIIKEVNISRLAIVHIMGDLNCVGFLTENGVFLTRSEALVYGRKIGQVKSLIGSVLTSEDLWDVDGVVL